MNASRYHAEGPQAEFEPGSRGRVLRNKLGIVRVRDIQQAESATLEAVQEWAIAHFGPHHRFTASDICQLHRRWLEDIYEWAGDYRAVNMTKDGFMFAAAGQVPRLMIEWERDSLRPATPAPTWMLSAWRKPWQELTPNLSSFTRSVREMAGAPACWRG